uniref:Phosphoinositide phospholipase C n=1 Tax=Salarias fasciatus TaxID=181472 RepID=A0A672F8M3_SALFA
MARASRQGEMTEYKKIVIKRDLEMGVVMTVFRQKAERLTVQVIMETRQVAWTRTADRTDGVLDLFEVREIRPGRNSKDFERFKDGKDKHDENTCFTIFYGSQFTLNTLSLGGHISIKELKALLPLMNCKAPNSRTLKDKFLVLNSHLGSSPVVVSCLGLQLHRNVFRLKKEMSVCDMAVLVVRPQEPWAGDLNQVRELMTTFIDDTMRKTNDPEFTVSEFLGFLFSKENSLWDEKFSQINNLDMNNPLSHYWISSSHNTYLTGDQLRSESSTEAYVRCLRLGCRCVELDCWEGPGEPIITHGWTRTTKIKFEDVVKAINEHAFVTSDFPLILSIEEHCPLEQQRQMARIFRDVFGTKLLCEAVEQLAEQLPSPTQLKGRIILKVSNAVTPGGGRVKSDDQRWNRHYCVISDNKLYYAEEYEEDEDLQKQHSSEPWFHDRMRDGRLEAERLIQNYCAESGGPDGAFLVRKSDRNLDDFSLSFWRGGRVQHCRIRSGSEGGAAFFYLTPNLHFSNVFALIQYYRETPLRCQDFELRLTEPVPKLESHQNQGWFYSNLSRGEAEDYLLRIPRDGAFLIRQREGEPDSFAITFRGDGKVKHCRIQKEGSMFLLGTTTDFDSLVELVSYFRKKPLYRKTKLRYAVTPELVERFSTGTHCTSLYEMNTYVAPNDIEPSLSTVRAVYSYRAARPDELSFSKGALIHNVSKESNDWWKGDLGGKIQHFFPANYVEELSNNPQPDTRAQDLEDNPLGELCKAPCVPVAVCSGKNGKPHVLTLQNLEQENLRFDLASDSVEELFEWYKVQQEEVEKKAEVAMEMSDLVVYCQPRSKEKDRFDSYSYKEIRSFVENKVPGKSRTRDFLQYNRKALSRVYPKGQRVESSNYDPYPLWAVGCHMVALNFQTADKYTQLNSALFSLNARTGYVLQPESKVRSASHVIAARHLPRPGRSIASPFVEVELCGHSEEKFKTTVYRDNGLNPVWKFPAEPFQFSVYEPELTFLRFVVNEEDMFSDPNFLAQATFPVKGIRSGYRSVPLQNGYSENLELASLLVYIDIKPAGKAEEELYSSSNQLRKKPGELSEGFLYDTHANIQRSAPLPPQHTLSRGFSSSERHRSKEKKISNSKFYS